jgi:hypothetical protein
MKIEMRKIRNIIRSSFTTLSLFFPPQQPKKEEKTIKIITQMMTVESRDE